jgi:4,5-epoxidase
MQRRVWETLSQLKVTYRDGPLGGRRRGDAPRPGDRVPDIACGRTSLHAELGSKWALVMPGRMMSDECAAVVATRLGDDRLSTLVADDDSGGEIMLVRPDAHLGWRGRADPDALDRWLVAMARHGRAG